MKLLEYNLEYYLYNQFHYNYNIILVNDMVNLLILLIYYDYNIIFVILKVILVILINYYYLNLIFLNFLVIYDLIYQIHIDLYILIH